LGHSPFDVGDRSRTPRFSNKSANVCGARMTATAKVVIPRGSSMGLVKGHVAIGFALLLAGCVGDDSTDAFPVPSDGGADHTVAVDASPADAGDADAPSLTTAVVRFAIWAPDAPPVDFCLARGSSPFAGPVLASRFPSDAGPAALTFPNVSAYFEIPPGHYSARTVAAGVDDCATPIADDVALPDLPAGTFATIALVGDAHPVTGAPGLAIRGYLDDDRARSGVVIRFVHAAPSAPPVDVGAGASASAFSAWFQHVAFGAVGAALDGGAPDGAPAIDGHGYAAMSALSQATLRVRAHGGTDDLAIAEGVSVAGGAMVTIALLDGNGLVVDGGGASSAQLLECVDNAGTVGLLGSCSLMAP
jgi:hypothetical protein